MWNVLLGHNAQPKNSQHSVNVLPAAACKPSGCRGYHSPVQRLRGSVSLEKQSYFYIQSCTTAAGAFSKRSSHHLSRTIYKPEPLYIAHAPLSTDRQKPKCIRNLKRSQTATSNRLLLFFLPFPTRSPTPRMSLTPYGLGLGLNDPFFGQLEKAMDRAFDRALGSRGGDITMFLPSLTGPSTSSGHPMVSRP